VPKLSVTVITRNESANIAGALESVAWADDIVVVDSESHDDTVARARPFTERVVVRPWSGYAAQKNYAASLAAHDWIFSLDADERVTPALAAEIRTALAADPPHAGYRIPRVAHHLGRWIRTTDWYPDDQLRLYDRRAAEWTGAYVHESVRVNGTVGRLRTSFSITRIETSPIISKPSIATRPSPPATCTSADAVPACFRSPATRRLPSSATIYCAAASATACRA
jgi:glycosyltransferase involved in cell wall biosynthesis